MKCLAPLLLAGMTAAELCAADVVALARVRNALNLSLEDGRAEVEWITASTVRVRRDWTKREGLIATRQRPALNITVRESETEIVARSRDLMVEIRKQPFSIRFLTDQDALLASMRDPVRGAAGEAAQVLIETSIDERFFGLGPRSSPSLNARGLVTRTDQPFLLSSKMYGLYFPRGGDYRFDVAHKNADRIVVGCPETDRIDFFFYSAGGLKELLMQHRAANPDDFEFSRQEIAEPQTAKPDYAYSLPRAWPEALHSLMNASLSASLIPAFALSALDSQAAAKLLEPFAAIMPVLIADSETRLSPEGQRLRNSFVTHLATYVQEARDRGLPVIHPLPLQFPSDPRVAEISDEFMFGDEILVAPMLDGAHERSVYLPQGSWTELGTERIYQGHQAIRVDARPDALAMFVRNGMIVPRDREFGIELHYFPKLGAEYFIAETELGLVTQVHAAPSVDVLRLQIEERVGREYEWVIHHVMRPTVVMRGDERLRGEDWHYDENFSRLHIPVQVVSGDDVILNVKFPREEWYLNPQRDPSRRHP